MLKSSPPASSFPERQLQEETYLGDLWGCEGLLASWGPAKSTAKIHGFAGVCFLDIVGTTQQPHLQHHLPKSQLSLSWNHGSFAFQTWLPLALALLCTLTHAMVAPWQCLTRSGLPTSHASHWGPWCSLQVQAMGNWQGGEVGTVSVPLSHHLVTKSSLPYHRQHRQVFSYCPKWKGGQSLDCSGILPQKLFLILTYLGFWSRERGQNTCLAPVGIWDGSWNPCTKT